MAIVLRLGTNGDLQRIQAGESVQADSFERLSASGNLTVGSTLATGERVVLGQATTQALFAADVAGITKGAASQTANLHEYQSSTGDILSYVDAAGNLNMGNHNLDDVATANYYQWPALTPSTGAVTVNFASYQAATVTLDAATVAITLNTPRGPGAYKLVIIQDATGSRAVTWTRQGSEPMYAPDAALTIASAANAVTLVGLIFDGSSWFAVSSQPMQAL